MSSIHSGSCLCGKVSYRVNGPLRPVTACHCSQCRKQSGLYYAATAAKNEDLTVEGADHITWFEASDFAKRGFCKHCGSALFWKADDEDSTSILAGSLDGTPPVELAEHIFVADKPDFYEISDGLPQFEQGRSSKQIK